MNDTKTNRPISYLMSNADDLAREIAERSSTVIITENGEPSFVCLAFDEYEQLQETIALLKLIHLGRQDIQESKFTELSEARRQLDQRILNGSRRKT